MKIFILLALSTVILHQSIFAQGNDTEKINLMVQAGHTITQFTVTDNERYVLTTDYNSFAIWDLRKRKMISMTQLQINEIFAHPFNPRYICIVPKDQYAHNLKYFDVYDAVSGTQVDKIEKSKVNPRKTFTNELTLKLNNGIIDIYTSETDNFLGSLDATPVALSGSLDINKKNGNILVGGLSPIVWIPDNLTAYRPMDYYSYLETVAAKSEKLVIQNDYTVPRSINFSQYTYGWGSKRTTSARFEDDGTISVFGYNGDISYWNPDGSLHKTINAKTDGPIFTAYNHKGNTVAVAYKGLFTGKEGKHLEPNAYFNDKLGQFKVLYDMTPPLINGKYLVACDNSKVVIGDFTTPSYYDVFRPATNPVMSVKVDSLQEWALLAGEGMVQESKLDDQYSNIYYDISGLAGRIDCATYLPGNIIAAGNGNGIVGFWERGTPEQIKKTDIHKANINDITLSINQKQFYTCDDTGCITIWNCKDLQPVVQMRRIGKDDYMYITPDNFYTGSKGMNNKVHFLKGLQILSFEQFDLVYNRPDIIAARLGAPQEKIALLETAWKRRVRRMGFTTEELSTEMHAPVLHIINEKTFPHITSKESITLKIKAHDSKYQLSRLMITNNGVPVHSRSGYDITENKSNEIITEKTVELTAGRNHIEVTCMNSKGAESYKAQLDIECDRPKRKPTLYLGVIGISNYQDKTYDLGYASKDASDFKKLIEQYCKKKFKEIKVVSLNDSQATKNDIQKLHKFYADAHIDDVAVLFYAGHGVLDKDLNYFLATHDMNFANPSTTGLSFDEFEDMMDGIKPLAKYCFIDACHSGKIQKEEFETDNTRIVAEGSIVFRGNGAIMKLSENAKNINNAINSLFTDFTKGNGATVLSSSNGMEVAIEDQNIGNGLFTWAIKQGISGRKADTDKDGIINIQELANYINQKVTNLSSGVQTPGLRVENKYINFNLFQ